MQYILMGNSVKRMSSIISKDCLTTYTRSIIFLSTGTVELTVKKKSTREVHVEQEYTYHAIKAPKRTGMSFSALQCLWTLKLIVGTSMFKTLNTASTDEKLRGLCLSKAYICLEKIFIG